jgi:hypothetical protein
MGVDITIGQNLHATSVDEPAVREEKHEQAPSWAPAHCFKNNHWGMSCGAFDACAEDPDLPEFLEPLFCSKTDGVIVPVTEEMRTPSDYVWPQDSIHFGAWYTYWIEWALKNCSEPVIYLN